MSRVPLSLSRTAMESGTVHPYPVCSRRRPRCRSAAVAESWYVGRTKAKGPGTRGWLLGSLNDADECRKRRLDVEALFELGFMLLLSQMSEVIRSVLFDLDGTMVDNMRYHVNAWI